MKKIIKAVCTLGLSCMLVFGLTGCASWSRFWTDLKSDVGGGLNRTITVYTADGKELATYEGKIDIDTNDGGYAEVTYNKDKDEMYVDIYQKIIHNQISSDEFNFEA